MDDKSIIEVENGFNYEKDIPKIVDEFIKTEEKILLSVIEEMSSTTESNSEEIYEKYREDFNLFISNYNFKYFTSKDLDDIERVKTIIDIILKHEKEEFQLKNFYGNFYALGMEIIRYLRENEIISYDILNRIFLYLDSSRLIEEFDKEIYVKIYSVLLSRFNLAVEEFGVDKMVSILKENNYTEKIFESFTDDNRELQFEYMKYILEFKYKYMVDDIESDAMIQKFFNNELENFEDSKIFLKSIPIEVILYKSNNAPVLPHFFEQVRKTYSMDESVILMEIMRKKIDKLTIEERSEFEKNKYCYVKKILN